METKPLTEAGWWDKYGQINEDIWHYNSYLHNIVRAGYLQEMQNFLFKANGRLLDFGCGGGWVSIPLVEKGMHVEGIDVSAEQIIRAQEKVSELNLTNAFYTCGDETLITQKGPFDSIVIHSVLHHLHDEEKRNLVMAVSRSLKPGGRLFLYEPMAISPQRPWYGKLFDGGMIVFFRLLRRLALAFKWYLPEIDVLERNNWTMESPDEAPIPYQQLLDIVPDGFQLISSIYWQAYSVKYANFCMSLRPKWLHRLQKLAPVFYRLDQIILNTSLRHSVKVWPMASFLFEKQGE